MRTMIVKHEQIVPNIAPAGVRWAMVVNNVVDGQAHPVV